LPCLRWLKSQHDETEIYFSENHVTRKVRVLSRDKHASASVAKRPKINIVIETLTTSGYRGSELDNQREIS